MKRRNKKRAKNARVIRLWSLQEVDKAVPYLHSVIGSIRENWLDVQSLKREAVLVEKRIPASTKRLVALGPSCRAPRGTALRVSRRNAAARPRRVRRWRRRQQAPG